MPRRQLRLARVLLGSVRALDESGPRRVGLSRVEDASDLDISAVVEADPGQAQMIVPRPATASPGGQFRNGPLRLGRALPRRAQGERAAQVQLAALVRLAVGAENL